MNGIPNIMVLFIQPQFKNLVVGGGGIDNKLSERVKFWGIGWLWIMSFDDIKGKSGSLVFVRVLETIKKVKKGKGWENG